MHNLLRWFCTFTITIVITSLASAEPRGNTTLQSFNKAKKLMSQVFAGHETTFYCGCAYTGNVINHASCGYQARKDAKRAKRLEAVW